MCQHLEKLSFFTFYLFSHGTNTHCAALYMTNMLMRLWLMEPISYNICLSLFVFSPTIKQTYDVIYRPLIYQSLLLSERTDADTSHNEQKV